MNIFTHFEKRIRSIIRELAEEGAIPQNLDLSRISCEPPRESGHGDIATNAAMVLAKDSGLPPRELAEMIAEKLRKKGEGEIADVKIAGAGFINMVLENRLWQERINDILEDPEAWGSSQIFKGQHVNVEYVSANPTGPLHAAHARGAIIGDALANLLEKVGYDVTREYYVNDAGAQVDILARSAYLRYRQALGEDIGTIPEGYYPGDYLKDTGQKLAKKYGDSLMDNNEEEWLPIIRSFAIDDMMKGIKHDLDRLGIKMDTFSSERGLVEKGKVFEAMKELVKKKLTYKGVLDPPKGKKPDDWEERKQRLFKATEFGDDTDRPIKKSDGSWTYFASDVAYHRDKLSRGANRLINIWGADHGGYVKRMVAATTALSGDKDALDVRLCQLVNLMDKGKPVKMSKRAGTFITLSDVLDSLYRKDINGKDILRFAMLTRRSNETMDFDYAKVTEPSKDNPTFYVNYAHARAISVLRKAAKQFKIQVEDGEKPEDALMELIKNTHISPLNDEAELNLIKLMASYPRQVEAAAQAHEPHRISFYLYELATAFHALWNKGNEHQDLKFIIEEKLNLEQLTLNILTESIHQHPTYARLKMVYALALVIRNGLAILGVEAVEEM